MNLPSRLTAIASPKVVSPRNNSCLPPTQRTGRRGPVGSSQKPTIVAPLAEIALARLLLWPGGRPSDQLPYLTVHANASASEQFQASPTATEPSPFKPQPLPQLLPT